MKFSDFHDENLVHTSTPTLRIVLSQCNCPVTSYPMRVELRSFFIYVNKDHKEHIGEEVSW